MKPNRFSRYRTAYLRRLTGIALSGISVFALWYLFVATKLGQSVDTLAMFTLARLNQNFFGWDQLLLREAYWFLVLPTLVTAGLVALVRKRYYLGIRMVLMVLLASGGVQILKHLLLERPALGITYYMTNSYPSGHTAIAASAAAALVMVSASQWRIWLARLMVIYLVLVGLAVTVARWHRPSDVYGSLCVTLLMALILTPIEDNRQAKFRFRPDRKNKRWYPKLSNGGGAILLIGIATLLLGTGKLKHLSDHSATLFTTQQLSHLAEQSQGVTWLISLGTLGILIGLASLGMGEICELSKNRAQTQNLGKPVE